MNRHWVVTILAVGCLLAAFALALRTLADPRANFDRFGYNSDSLYPPRSTTTASSVAYR